MAVGITKKKGLLLLGVWAILEGLIQVMTMPEPFKTYVPWGAAILAVVAGILVILDI